MSTPVVKIENLVKRYKELVALDHFNLEIEEGEVLGILGRSGSGKSVASLAIAGLLQKAKISGEVIFAEKNLLTLNFHFD